MDRDDYQQPRGLDGEIVGVEDIFEPQRQVVRGDERVHRGVNPGPNRILMGGQNGGMADGGMADDEIVRVEVQRGEDEQGDGERNYIHRGINPGPANSSIQAHGNPRPTIEPSSSSVADNRKRAGSVSIDELRVNTPRDSPFHRVQDIFPTVHAATLRYKVRIMEQSGYPSAAIIDALTNNLIESSGNFPEAEQVRDEALKEAILTRIASNMNLITPFNGHGLGQGDYRGASLRLKALQEIFVGIQKVSLETCLRQHNCSLTRTVLTILRILVEKEPALAQCMLCRQILRHRQHSALSHGPRIIKATAGPANTLLIMKVWRPYRPTNHRGLQDELKALNEFFDSLGFEIPQETRSTTTPLSDIPLLEEDSFAPTEPGDHQCQCCFGDYAFHCMVQCFEGHLFCKDCMRQYAQSAISGEGKATLSCMAEDCGLGFPRNQLESTLAPKILGLLDERDQEESIRVATSGDRGEGETLSKCPHCPFKCFLPPGNKVIECLNPSCNRKTCIICQEDWEGHFGVPCAELEKKDEATLRTAAEEKMTAALLRRCLKCATPLIKEEGCNKLTCRCGAKMCYVCRAPIKDYSHFCTIKGCTKCQKCSLWSNPKEDDDRAIEEIRQQAEKSKKEQGYENDRRIGVFRDLSGAPGKKGKKGKKE